MGINTQWGVGASPGWTATGSKTPSRLFFSYNAFSVFATAAPPTGGKPPRHTSPPQLCISTSIPNRKPLVEEDDAARRRALERAGGTDLALRLAAEHDPGAPVCAGQLQRAEGV